MQACIIYDACMSRASFMYIIVGDTYVDIYGSYKLHIICHVCFSEDLEQWSGSGQGLGLTHTECSCEI